MLITNSVKKGDVAILKLTSKEEVIGKVTNINEKEVTLSKPFELVLTQAPNGQGAAVAFTPFMLGLGEDVECSINRNTIIVLAKAREDAASQYIGATSGIEVASASALNNLTMPKG